MEREFERQTGTGTAQRVSHIDGEYKRSDRKRLHWPGCGKRSAAMARRCKEFSRMATRKSGQVWFKGGDCIPRIFAGKSCCRARVLLGPPHEPRRPVHGNHA